MLRSFPDDIAVYIACGYTDLRKGIDSLAYLVKHEFDLDPFSPALFLFCGRRADRFKALYWDENSFLLLYKRFETGSLQWPRTADAVRLLSQQQYRWLLEGLRPLQPKAIAPIRSIELG